MTVYMTTNDANAAGVGVSCHHGNFCQAIRSLALVSVILQRGYDRPPIPPIFGGLSSVQNQGHNYHDPEAIPEKAATIPRSCRASLFLHRFK